MASETSMLLLLMFLEIITCSSRSFTGQISHGKPCSLSLKAHACQNYSRSVKVSVFGIILIHIFHGLSYVDFCKIFFHDATCMFRKEINIIIIIIIIIVVIIIIIMMLKAWTFPQNKFHHRCFDNGLQKTFRTNILENTTEPMFLLVVLMVGLCFEN